MRARKSMPTVSTSVCLRVKRVHIHVHAGPHLPLLPDTTVVVEEHQAVWRLAAGLHKAVASCRRPEAQVLPLRA